MFINLEIYLKVEIRGASGSASASPMTQEKSRTVRLNPVRPGSSGPHIGQKFNPDSLNILLLYNCKIMQKSQKNISKFEKNAQKSRFIYLIKFSENLRITKLFCIFWARYGICAYF